jgi:hypothetical protein
MKFLCIGYFSPPAMSALSREELDQVMAKCGPHLREFYGTGQVLMDAGLGSSSRLMRQRDGAVQVTDGACTEAGEVIGSVFLIEAADTKDALRVAALHPTTQVPEGEFLGWRIEVRPVDYSGPPPSRN